MPTSREQLMPTPPDPRKRAQECRAAKTAQRRQNERARHALEQVAGADLHNPFSLHPLRQLSPFPGAYSDGPADLSWNPVDVFGAQPREH